MIKCAILGPTPGNAIRPFNVLGISITESSVAFSRSISQVFLMYRALLLKKLTGWINSANFFSEIAEMESTVNPTTTH